MYRKQVVKFIPFSGVEFANKDRYLEKAKGVCIREVSFISVLDRDYTSLFTLIR